MFKSLKSLVCIAIILPSLIVKVEANPVNGSLPYNSIMMTSLYNGNFPNTAPFVNVPAIANKTFYLEGVIFATSGATTANLVTCTISNINGGNGATLSQIGFPILAGTPSQMSIEFASALPVLNNTSVLGLSCAAHGVGNVLAIVVAHGYYQ